MCSAYIVFKNKDYSQCLVLTACIIAMRFLKHHFQHSTQFVYAIYIWSISCQYFANYCKYIVFHKLVNKYIVRRKQTLIFLCKKTRIYLAKWIPKQTFYLIQSRSKFSCSVLKKFIIFFWTHNTRKSLKFILRPQKLYLGLVAL